MKRLLTCLSLTLMLATTAWGEAQVGKSAPAFTAQSSSGKKIQLSDYNKKYVVLEWVNFDCPFVRRQYDSNQMQSLQSKWAEKGVVWLSICSSAPGKQGYLEAAAMEKKLAAEKSRANFMLLDPKGEIGRLYGAKTTPHMFVINPEGKVIYAGAIDNKGQENYVDSALQKATAGQPVSPAQTQAYGCSVKYSE